MGVAARRAFRGLSMRRATRLRKDYSKASTATRILRDRCIRMWIGASRASIFFACVAINLVSIGRQDARLGQIIGHDHVEPRVAGPLTRCDLGFHGPACCMDAQVDPGREATS